jgi:AAHS family 3-hydroxyphenylpropionic acid transporter
MATDATTTRPGIAMTVTLCFLVAVIEGFDLQVMSAIGPLVRGPLQLNPGQLGFIFSSSLIGLAIGATFGGYMADRIGRKRVIVLSAFAMCLLTFATAAVYDYWSLFIARVLTGLAIGGAMPNTLVMVESMTDRGRAAGVVTLMLCGIPAGGILAALASYALADRAGWQGVLIFGGVVALLVANSAQLWLRDQKQGSTRKQSHMGIGQVLFGEGRAATTVLLWTLMILSLAVVASLANWLPTLAVDKGLGTWAGFSSLLAWNLGGVVGIIAIGRLCDLLGPRNALIFAYLAMGLMFVLFAQLSTAATFFLFAAVVNFFVAGSHYTVYGLAPRLYPAESAGTGVGATMAAGRLGAILGPSVIGLLLHTGSTGGQVVFGLVPIAVICTLCVIALVAVSRGKLDRPGETAALRTPAPETRSK